MDNLVRLNEWMDEWIDEWMDEMYIERNVCMFKYEFLQFLFWIFYIDIEITLYLHKIIQIAVLRE